MISHCSQRRRARAAALAPPATPPTITILFFINPCSASPATRTLPIGFADLVPGHACQHHCHPAFVGNTREHQTATHKGGQREDCRMHHCAEHRSQQHERPSHYPYLPFQTHDLPSRSLNRQTSFQPSGDAPFHQHTPSHSGRLQLPHCLLRPRSRLANDINFIR